MPGRIVLGSGALESSDAAAIFRGAGSKALIVTGPVMKNKCEGLMRVLDAENIAYELFSGITGEPTEIMIDEGVRVYLEAGCDFLIAFGGGSPLDAMKAIGVMLKGGKISDYMGKVIDAEMPKMIAIPTTAGTGSEATQFTIITDTETDIKMLLKGGCLMPDAAIIDPEFTMSAPREVTAATGLDALCHAVEAFTSRKAHAMTDTFAKSAVVRIFKNLPICYADGSDKGAREQMALASLEAGIAFNNSSVTIIHGMSRPIGALFHVAHGISNAMLMGECLAFALPGAYERFAELGRAIGAAGDEDDAETAAKKFLEALKNLAEVLEIPTLEEYGIDKTRFMSLTEKMAGDAIASGSPGNTVREVTKEDVIAIYNRLWN